MRYMRRDERRAVFLLALLILIGISLLSIPLGLTPHAFLEIAAFDGVLTGYTVSVEVASGRVTLLKARNVESDFVVDVCRIGSGAMTFALDLEGFQRAPAAASPPPLEHGRLIPRPDRDQGIWPVAPVRAFRDDIPLVADEYCRKPVLLRARGDTPKSPRGGVKS